ncbi:DUF3806 domain-containing protein [Rathayibacter tritici]|uniref:DUF3806 domain-containing protein n=1 Tax=Rathayibacter tritici TaxID=33888 RepID=A0A160KS70_9MICO|nr:DUF3806 domain-containing protein [Rathayibacter tritici]AND16199.1 hypothetical protein A6122_1050 [Rathayibacter tritici]PPI42806.1 DUF3806 domain-containing protein [Rathayibacter tritici]
MKKFFQRPASKRPLAFIQTEPRFSEPNEAEKTWMAGHLPLAADLGVEVADIAQIVSLYELILQSWRYFPAENPSDPTVSVNALGTVFGEHLVRRTMMRGVMATDEYGTELAVHDSATSTLIYPPNAVAKRWTAGESGAIRSTWFRASTGDSAQKSMTSLFTLS